ncbi:hypothetical protein [uncultured Roseobacter sp.]|uniref:hypothetical protein n=1 Tax=uncultured Roseobacter sp. TaxID=114847 RepID=UPI00262CC2DE|nr:hypothetical protein [uncultured Roseobacter sp.]
MALKRFATIAILTVFPFAALPQTHGVGHGHDASPYAGEQARDIKALSESDLEEIALGAGWGLALPAELNGVPGPTHLLELADALGLDARQREEIEAIRAQMQADAIAAGIVFVDAERALDTAFRMSVPDQEVLARLVADTAAARAALRLVHLQAHLRTAPLLTEDQIARYAVLRGYADDPCAQTPEGHDPEMWRRHNGCG